MTDKKHKEKQENQEPLEKKNNEILECQKQRDEYLAGWQRARADLLNYKKEEMERLEQLLKFAGEEFVLKILPMMDNFLLIEKKIPEELKKDENVKGILRLKDQLAEFLKMNGVEEIKALDSMFDPNFHEAVEMVEGDKPGMVLEEVQKGYIIKGRVLRPAKVKVIK